MTHYDFVGISDSRDYVFQRDPFPMLKEMESKLANETKSKLTLYGNHSFSFTEGDQRFGVLFSLEGGAMKPKSIESCPYNSVWVRDVSDKTVMPKLNHNQLGVLGSVSGTLSQ